MKIEEEIARHYRGAPEAIAATFIVHMPCVQLAPKGVPWWETEKFATHFFAVYRRASEKTS